MSNKSVLSLRDKIQKTIDDHFSDQGAIATAWYLAVDGIDSDGDKTWSFCYPLQQTSVTSAGLLLFADMHSKLQMANMLNGSEDDDAD